MSLYIFWSWKTIELYNVSPLVGSSIYNNDLFLIMKWLNRSYFIIKTKKSLIIIHRHTLQSPLCGLSRVSPGQYVLWCALPDIVFSLVMLNLIVFEITNSSRRIFFMMSLRKRTEMQKYLFIGQNKKLQEIFDDTTTFVLASYYTIFLLVGLRMLEACEDSAKIFKLISSQLGIRIWKTQMSRIRQQSLRHV